jgi:hypothetical protein
VATAIAFAGEKPFFSAQEALALCPPPDKGIEAFYNEQQLVKPRALLLEKNLLPIGSSELCSSLAFMPRMGYHAGGNFWRF